MSISATLMFMDSGNLNFALKLIQEEYKLSDEQIQILYRRMLADDKEFERIWRIFKNKAHGKGDKFKDLLSDLLN